MMTATRSDDRVKNVEEYSVIYSLATTLGIFAFLHLKSLRSVVTAATLATGSSHAVRRADEKKSAKKYNLTVDSH